jgi:hypothetical protein
MMLRFRSQSINFDSTMDHRVESLIGGWELGCAVGISIRAEDTFTLRSPEPNDSNERNAI